MTIEAISEIAAKLRRIHETADPFKLAQYLGILVKEFPMGCEENACKGFFMVSNRIPIIMLNSDLDEMTKWFTCAHELGHAVLHRDVALVQPFQDYRLFDSKSHTEYEANIFFAELMLEDERVLEVLNEDTSFFNAARMLEVPPELLDFKFRILKRKGYQVQPMMIANADFMKGITKQNRLGQN